MPHTYLPFTIPQFLRFNLHPLLFSFLLCTCLFPIVSQAARLSSAFSRQSTRQDDIIGIYAKHPETALLGDHSICPDTISVRTFEYFTSVKPADIDAPNAFNIRIPFVDIRINNRKCNTIGHIYAVPNGHHFVDDPYSAIHAWAGAGNKDVPVPWLRNSTFVESAVEDSWVVGYEYGNFHCRQFHIPAASYLWIQPSQAESIGNVQLSPEMKYLILTFSKNPLQACLFKALIVGGQPGFSNGPQSDPTNPTATHDPDALGQWSASPSPPSNGAPSKTEPPETSYSPLESEEEELSSSPTSPLNGSPQPGPSEPSSSSGGGVFTSDGNSDQNQNPNQNSGVSACFPARAQVTLNDGSTVPMHSLQIGHSARVSTNQYSPIFFFSHSDRTLHTLHKFIQISVQSGHKLLLSPAHYVYLSDGYMIQAAAVRPHSHALVLADGSPSTVVDVRTVFDYGLFAPHTIHGDIIVDGILASTYTAAVNPWVAHYVLLPPLRALYHLGLKHTPSNLFTYGASTLARLAPQGPAQVQAFL